MDNLLDALQKGTAFNVRDGGRKRTPRTTGGQYRDPLVMSAYAVLYILIVLPYVLHLLTAERRAQLQKSRSRSHVNNGGEFTAREIDGSLLNSETPRRPERRKKSRPSE